MNLEKIGTDANNPLNEQEVKELFAKIKLRDKEAFIKAYDLYADQVYRFVYFKVSDEEEARDLSSTVFLKTWDYIQKNSINDCGTVRGLIYKIARTTIIDYYRKNSSRDDLPLDQAPESVGLLNEEKSILDKLNKDSDLAIIAEGLKNIKEEYREVIILKYIEDLPTDEIARIMEKSKGGTRVLIHRALAALKKNLKKDHAK